MLSDRTAPACPIDENILKTLFLNSISPFGKQAEWNITSMLDYISLAGGLIVLLLSR